MPKFRDITGMRFGRLVALEYAGKGINKQTLWICKCDCGNKTIVRLESLTSGRTQSCGCKMRRRIIRHEDI